MPRAHAVSAVTSNKVIMELKMTIVWWLYAMAALQLIHCRTEYLMLSKDLVGLYLLFVLSLLIITRKGKGEGKLKTRAFLCPSV